MYKCGRRLYVHCVVYSRIVSMYSSRSYHYLCSSKWQCSVLPYEINYLYINIDTFVFSFFFNCNSIHFSLLVFASPPPPPNVPTILSGRLSSYATDCYKPLVISNLHFMCNWIFHSLFVLYHFIRSSFLDI